MIVRKAVNDCLCLFDLEHFRGYLAHTFKVQIDDKGHRQVLFGDKGPLYTKQYSRIITNCPEDREVDHIDGDELNNCFDNLRICTHQQNCFNRSGWSKKSLPKGVYERNGRYRVAICINAKLIHIGTFNTIEVAEQKYKEAANHYQGMYAFHNSRSEKCL